ncbi:MAG: hypothetical protein ABNH21_06760 [Glaciecola sp.]|jgi:hypothetical protein
MKATNLTLRCFGEKQNGQWSIVCIDLCLAAQAKTEEEAKAKLAAQIKDYICDALIGDDQEYADELLSRKAPMSLLLKYQWIKAKVKLQHAKEKAKQFVFIEPMPLKPC